MVQAPPPTNNPREEGKTAGIDESSWVWDRGVLIAYASQKRSGGAPYTAAAGKPGLDGEDNRHPSQQQPKMTLL